AVLEHVDPKMLEAMMADFRRILVPGGAMVHFIDYSDHYAMCDSSISRCNFLQYEDWVWRLCCVVGVCGGVGATPLARALGERERASLFWGGGKIFSRALRAVSPGAR